MKDILSDIVASKRLELRRQQEVVPAETLRRRIESEGIGLPATRSMKRALACSPTGIIAEFKRRSPSKGWIHADASPTDICPAYERAGAAALSVLTDEPFFGGTLRDLQAVRRCANLPLLRKDFIVDEYQLLQARLSGADAVLLIAACLTPEQCAKLAREAHRLQLEVLLEIHAAKELSCLGEDIDMLGVNNRHLGSFETDVRHSFELAEALAALPAVANPPLLVSESGLSDAQVVKQLRRAGYRGFLIGEAFMKHPRPGEALSAFVRTLQDEKR